MEGLLHRDEFREAVFKRDGYLCVHCKRPGQDAHHLIERRLWDDGGYYLDNGVTLCGECHLLAESTVLSVETLRVEANILKAILPAILEDDHVYDKWGNIILPNEMRMRGPLFYDSSVQKVIAPVLDRFLRYTKYPRTPHLPGSNGTSDDLYGKDFDSADEVVITEKMDGENTTMYRDHIHARSLDSNYHPTRTWVKDFWSKHIAYQIPENMRICGENMFAAHSLKYDSLTSFFLGFSIWEDNLCLSWKDTMDNFEILGVTPVPVLFEGRYGDFNPTLDFSVQEGYVVRSIYEFSLSEFQENVGKFVRPNHVQTRKHWLAGSIERNKLK